MKNRLKVALLSGLLVLVASASAWAQTTSNPSQTAPDPPPTTPDPPQACPKPPQMTYDEVGEFLTSDCRNGLPDPIQYISARPRREPLRLDWLVDSRTRRILQQSELFRPPIGKRLPDAALLSARGFSPR